MQQLETKLDHEELLSLAGEELDLPPERYELAESTYRELGAWLEAPGSELESLDLAVYVQGSFRTGTAVRPPSGDDACDIDAVCELGLSKDEVTQADLKRVVGERLYQNSSYRDVLKEGRRCWTLTPEPGFHVDVLPALPDTDRIDESILVPDRKLIRWQHSNPKGYAGWFVDSMRNVFDARRVALAAELKAEVEEVPTWRVRTPLQRAVQLLKRHRDLMFADTSDIKPISIIVTTLASLAYRGEQETGVAFLQIAKRLPNLLQVRDGEYWIGNPVNEEENFADKWSEYPERQTAFLRWLRALTEDTKRLLEAEGLPLVRSALGSIAGVRAAEAAAVRFGERIRAQRYDGRLQMGAGGARSGQSV